MISLYKKIASHPIAGRLIQFFSSLKLTVILLALSMILIFIGTLAQTTMGIWQAQKAFFHSYVVIRDFPEWGLRIPIFPGGFTLGGLLLVNLIAAHLTRFHLSWKKFGIHLTHAGIVLLLLGEFFSSTLSKENQMVLDVGQTKSYSEAMRGTELAIIDQTDTQMDKVVTIPEEMLIPMSTISHPNLPFQIKVVDFMPNAQLAMRSNVAGAPPSPATQGIGTQIHAVGIPRTARDNEADMTTSFITILAPSENLGTWLVANGLGAPQTFEYQSRKYKLQMRFKRSYKSFSLTLLEFRHDKYIGTDIPKNFASRIKISDPSHGEDRETLIFMNNPLRYGGYTFYQHSFANGDKTSILQVVQNPAWQIPYIACTLVSIGLLYQFIWHLASYLGRRKS